MSSKKKKFNARFPAGRIKKIMQKDEEIGKLAHGVPVVVSRAVELFLTTLMTRTAEITKERGARTLTLMHTKQCIMNDPRFEFLKGLAQKIPDIGPDEDAKKERKKYEPGRSRKRTRSSNDEDSDSSESESKT